MKFKKLFSIMLITFISISIFSAVLQAKEINQKYVYNLEDGNYVCLVSSIVDEQWKPKRVLSKKEMIKSKFSFEKKGNKIIDATKTVFITNSKPTENMIFKNEKAQFQMVTGKMLSSPKVNELFKMGGIIKNKMNIMIECKRIK